jgi:REP element-mobilizing transposase RayT
MLRQSRIDAPGALHHIIVRSIERRKIFLDDQVRELGESMTAMTRRLGISTAAVSKAPIREAEIADQNG